MNAELYATWELAKLCRRANSLGSFVATCADDPDRAREARRLMEQAFAIDPANSYEIEKIVRQLVEWAEELADHPHRPPDPRPDEEDRQARDFVHGLLRDRWSADTRNEMARLQLSLDVTFDALRRTQSLDACAREDASYLYGRATMALDSGDRTAAKGELAPQPTIGMVAEVAAALGLRSHWCR